MPSSPHSQGAPAPVGFPLTMSRWLIRHQAGVGVVTVLLVVAACMLQGWMAYQDAQDWEANHRGHPVPFRLFAAAQWALIVGAGVWICLWRFSGRETTHPPLSEDADWWRFDMRERQRIFEGRAISRRFFWMHGVFGLLGFALGMVLALRLASAVGWQEEIVSRDQAAAGLVALVVLLMAFAARRIRDVLFLHRCDDFVGDRARDLARAVAQAAEAEAEAEQAYDRKRIAGWPLVVLMGGLIGGMFIAHRWLPEADGTTASQGCASGLIGSAAALYLLRMKPQGWRFWLLLTCACAVGFLVFTQVTWHRSPIYLLLGTLWGAGAGVAATELYLRQLRERR